jgi:pantothenate synthetase
MSQVPDTAFLTTIAERVSEVQMRYFDRLESSAIESKGRHRDLLTVADRESEEVIIRTIRERFPDHAILAEETGAHDLAQGRGADDASEAARFRIEAMGLRVDYVAVRDPDTLKPLHGPVKTARVLAAIHLGKTRLLDNVSVPPNN